MPSSLEANIGISVKLQLNFKNVEIILDGNDHFFKTIGGYAMPETILFDRIGNIVFHKRGSLLVSEFEPEIRKLLEQ